MKTEWIDNNEQCTMNNVQWKKVKLGDCCAINPKTDTTKVLDDDIITFIRMEDVSNEGFITSFREKDYKSLKKNGFTRFQNDDVIFAKITPCMENGKGALVRNMKSVICMGSTEFHVLRAGENVLIDFIYQLTISKNFRQKAEMKMIGSAGQQRVPTSFLENCLISIPFQNGIPSLPVQRRIAAILSSADKVIASTQKVIDKLKQIKQGMMDDLLKPKDGWRMVKLGELGTFKNGINKDKKQFGFGSLYVSISDAYYENIDFQLLNRLNATEKEIEEYSLLDNDIVFVRSSVKPSGVGYTTLFRHYDIEPVLFSGFMIRFRLNDKTHCCAEFFNYLFRNEEFRRQIINKSTVSANTNINQESLKELTCNVPDIAEQRKIARFLQGIDKKIQAETNLLNKYKEVKKGLMEKLLNN